MKSAIFTALLAAGLIVGGRGTTPPRPASVALTVRGSAAPSEGAIQPQYAGVDGHPAAGTDSNVNGVLEPGETVQVSPFWKNTLGTAQAFTGTASNLSGPPGPTYTLNINMADYGTVPPGATADCADATGNCYLLTVSGARPVPHWDVTFKETLGILGIVTTWTVHVGDSFTDVPTTHPFYAYIEQLFHLQVTTGCGGGLYCPSSSVTRAQMAVFLLKSEHGSAYVPPVCTGIFGDVLCPSQYADWIEQLSNEGITGGCGGGNYCPDNPVTRAQMAVFLLKTEHGSSYVPPTCTGIFGDVACPSQFANWIEQLFDEGITGGCGGDNYCPNAAVTRGQMAVFLLRTFSPLAPPVPTPTAPPLSPTLTPTSAITPTFTKTNTFTNTPMSPTATFTFTPGSPTLTPTNTTITPTNTPTPSTHHTVFVGQGGTHFVDSVSGTSTSTIPVGTTIEWDWVSSPHSSTSGICIDLSCAPDGLWTSGQHNSGFVYTRQFNSVGTFSYYCTVHTFMMTGVISVIPATPTPLPGRRR